MLAFILLKVSQKLVSLVRKLFLKCIFSGAEQKTAFLFQKPTKRTSFSDPEASKKLMLLVQKPTKRTSYTSALLFAHILVTLF
jgi:hypothetical protein